jgi:4-amino-4-deoxy-L-arabinose transferase-like glycosyltransferase
LRLNQRPGLVIAAFCLVFVLTGCLWISDPGIQNDEALFAAGIYTPRAIAYSVSLFGYTIPLMLMGYVGALKSWIYAGVFVFVEPSPVSLRVPAVLAGAAAICLFYLLLRRTAPRTVAVTACALLATDTTFLMTTRLDWGPVALQHVLLLGGVLLITNYHQTGSVAALTAGFFVFGLGLWDKALFLWPLGALLAATLIVFPRELIRTLRPRNVAFALAAFVAGSLPLVAYNIKRDFETFRSNSALTSEALAYKAQIAWQSVDGSALFGLIIGEDSPGSPRRPETDAERVSVWLSWASGEPRHSLLGFALAGSVLFLPWLWRTSARTPVLFSLVFLISGWLPMALTRGAGAGVHHPVLLWPFPHLLIACALVEAARLTGRRSTAALGALLALIMGSSLLLTNSFYSTMIRNGGAVNWSNAIYRLSHFLETREADFVVLADWGFVNPLSLLHQGRLPLIVLGSPLPPEPALVWISHPRSLFVAHTAGNEVSAGVAAELEDFASRNGFQKEPVRTLSDRNLRPVIEVFRFRDTGSGPGGFEPNPAVKSSRSALTPEVAEGGSPARVAKVERVGILFQGKRDIHPLSGPELPDAVRQMP